MKMTCFVSVKARFLALCLCLYYLFFASAHVMRDDTASSVTDLLLSEDSKSRILSFIINNMNELEENETVSVRNLAPGDFDAFNSLFAGARINLPPTSVSQQALFKLTLNLNEIYCTNVLVGDIILTYNMESSSRFTFQVDVVDLAMDCFIEYDYRYVVSGKGNAQAYSYNNQASVLFVFESSDFAQVVPTSSTVESCTADINLADLDFGGDWASQIMDVFEGLLRGTVESEVQKVACDELSSAGNGFVNDALVLASDTLAPYLAALSTVDPVAAENELNAPQDMKLLNFQDTENVIGSWFNALLQEADALLGTVVNDDNGPSGSGRDLGVNVFLREYLLDDDRAFVLDVAELPLENNGVLFAGHDMLTETTITLDRLKVFGLDTFTRFEPLLDIGKYTLQNELAWDYITLELDVTIDMKPSSKEDSIIEGPSDSNVIEQVKISVGVDQLDAVVSVLLAIDQEALGSLMLGPLLDTSNLLPCLLSTVHAVEVAQLDVSVANIRDPTLDGFVSAGLDRIVTRGVEALFLMFEPLLIKAVPNACATTVRDVINKEFLAKYTSNSKNSECPEMDTIEGFIDFRDLLLKPNLAAIQGGSGLEPYGDLASTLVALLKDQFLTTDEAGLPSINSKFIRQVTETQSGEKGMLQFPRKLFGLAEDNAMGLQLAVSDLRLRNLDTLTPPLSILQPSNDPHVLTNLINVGPVTGRPLNGTLRLLMSLENDDPSLSMMNEMDISASVTSALLSADMIAKLNARGVMDFPVRDILNINCWLAKFPSPVLDASGASLSPSDISLGLQDFFMGMSAFSMDVTCVSCSSPGVAVLPELLTLLEGLDSFSFLQTRLEDLGQDIIMSDWLQGYVEQLLHAAPKACPHSPEYIDNEATTTIFSNPGFPSLSRDAFETLVFAGAIAAQVGSVVVAESHADYVATSDKLSAQERVPEDVRLLNLTALGGSFVDSAIEEVNGYLAKMTDDVGGPNGDNDLAVNVMLRDFLLDERRALSFKFDDISIGEGDMKLALGELRIQGLDTFTAVNALNLIAPQTIDNQFRLDRLRVELDVSVTTDQSLEAEVMTIIFGLQDIDVTASVFLGILEDRLGALAVGSILNTNQILPCLLSTAYGVELTKLSVTVGAMDNLSFAGGFLSEAVEEKITLLTQTIHSTYGESMIAAMEGIFDDTVRRLLNNWVDHFISLDSSTSCPDLSFASSPSGFVVFPDLLLPAEEAVALGGTGKSQYGDLIRRLYGILNEEVLTTDEKGKSSLNDLLIAPLTRGESDTEGTLLFGDILNTGTRVQVGGLDARVGLKAYNARIENMDTVGEPLDLLEPVVNEPHLLNNTASFGVGPDPLRLGLTFLISLVGDDNMQIHNEIDITLDLKTATVAIAALVKIAEGRFVSFPMEDITNLNCWLATMPAPALDSRGLRLEGVEPSASLQQLVATVASMNLNVTCVSCTSPDMEELAALLSTKEGADDFTGAANNILDYAMDLLSGNFLQTTFDRLLSEAPKSCPHHPEYQTEPTKTVYEPFEAVDTSSSSAAFLITLMVAVACLVIAVLVVAFVVRRIVRRRNKKWLLSLPGHTISLMLTRQNLKKAKDAEINRMTTSMFKSTDIPLFVRLFMPVVILGNIALFLSGHLSQGATVNIVAEFGGEGFTVDNFFEFSMARSTIDIWKAGGKELAILIGLFSGVWPYTKQLITLALWFLPPRIVSVQRRGSTFLWLDTLGKWSMVDIFVLVISIAAFQVNIESPDVAFLPEGFYSVSLYVIPLWGLYANMIAQLVSQVSSHFIIHYQRRIADNALSACDRILGPCETTVTENSDVSQSSDGGSADTTGSNSDDVARTVLRKHAFERPHRGELDKVKVRRGVSPSIVFAALAITGLLIAGCIVPSLAVEVLGVLGVAVESGQEFNAAVTEFNVFSLVKLLFDEARFLNTPGDYLGLGTLGILFVMTILVVPVLQVATLLRQWFANLTEKQRTRMSVLTEIFQAWQYVEVYLLALIVSAWQLGPISAFMINSYCDGLDDTFATLVYYGVLDPVDAQCFKVQATIESGTFILIAASVLLFLLHTFVVKAVYQYQRDESLVCTAHQDAKLAENHSGLSRDEYDDAIEKLEPTSVLFTDTFRWAMRREDSVMTSRTRRGLDDRAKLGVSDRFPSDQPSELGIQMGEESSSYASTPGPSFDLESDTGSVLSTVLESAESVHLDAMLPVDEDCDEEAMSMDVYQYEDRDDEGSVPTEALENRST
jgi:hypothetical protein